MPVMHSFSRRPSLSATPAPGSRLAAVAQRTAPGDQSSDSSAVELDVVDSQSLLDGRPRIAIRHRDETYWLHETRQGKLLLTK